MLQFLRTGGGGEGERGKEAHGIRIGRVLEQGVAHARDLPTPGALPEQRPDPAVAAAEHLRGFLRLTWIESGLLAVCATWGPFAVSDARAAWLPGVPAVGIAVLAWFAREPKRRRVLLALAVALVATLAIATGGALARLDQWPPDPAVPWQATTFFCCAIFLGAAWPPFARAENARREAEAVAALFDEL